MAEFHCKYDAACGVFTDPRTLGKHYQSAHGSKPKPKATERRRCLVPGCGQEMARGGIHYHFQTKHEGASAAGLTEAVGEAVPVQYSRANHNDDPSECTICGHTGLRVNMAKHFRRWHPDAVWQMFVRKVEPVALVPFDDNLPAMPTVADFAMHDDGNGFTADDFFLPVVHQLSKPAGVVPFDAFPALMAYRDATTAMLAELAQLRKRTRRHG